MGEVGTPGRGTNEGAKADSAPFLPPIHMLAVRSAFERAAGDAGVIEPHRVEGVVAELLGEGLTDELLDVIIDATEAVPSVPYALFERVLRDVLMRTAAWGSLRTLLGGRVGFAAASEQAMAKALKRGFQLNLMALCPPAAPSPRGRR